MTDNQQTDQPSASESTGNGTTTQDVIVIGAGPAGAAAAIVAARGGASVTVFEKSGHGRDKVCGDGLTPRAVGALNELKIDLEFGEPDGAHRIDGLRMIAGKTTRELSWPQTSRFPDHGAVWPRRRLDAALIDAAARTDDVAQVEPTRRLDGIVTPEAVVLELETAGFASRIFAGMIDTVIQVVAIAFIAMALGLALAVGDSGAVTALAIATFAVIFGYPIGFETWLRGRTPGKIALGLRAVTVEGAPIRLRDATLRAMGGVVDRLLPPGGVTGALFVTLTPRHQRVGD
ncbi:MAG: RDD family protein, partial [Actinomycetota bacterium]